jgi:hypothetical protein
LPLRLRVRLEPPDDEGGYVAIGIAEGLEQLVAAGFAGFAEREQALSELLVAAVAAWPGQRAHRAARHGVSDDAKAV